MKKRHVDDTPSFDFGTDPTPIETHALHDVDGIHGEMAEEGESTKGRHVADGPQVPAIQGSAGSVVERHSEWNEVPQVLFNSWSLKMQLSYCAARDLDAAEHAGDLVEIEWYIVRAKGYQEMMHE